MVLFGLVFQVFDMFVTVRQSAIEEDRIHMEYMKVKEILKEKRLQEEKKECLQSARNREKKLKDNARLFREISAMCK